MATRSVKSCIGFPQKEINRVEELSAGRSDEVCERRPAHGLRSCLRAKSPKKKSVLRPKNTSKKETRGKCCMMRLPVLYYKPSSLNDQSFSFEIETFSSAALYWPFCSV